MRFSKTGLWGKAIYFAKNALYSNSYRFNSPAGKHQFFLVEVLLGDFVELAEKKSLTLPPNNPNGGAMYDSVKGNTGNSGGPHLHFEVRNLYGYEMQKTTYEALLKRETRPFLSQLILNCIRNYFTFFLNKAKYKQYDQNCLDVKSVEFFFIWRDT